MIPLFQQTDFIRSEVHSPTRLTKPHNISTSRWLLMSSLFDLDDDGFRHVLCWFDVGCICKLDIAIGNVDERSWWLHSLHTMDSKAVDEYEHNHSSLRWLISRGAGATKI